MILHDYPWITITISQKSEICSRSHAVIIIAILLLGIIRYLRYNFHYLLRWYPLSTICYTAGDTTRAPASGSCWRLPAAHAAHATLQQAQRVTGFEKNEQIARIFGTSWRRSGKNGMIQTCIHFYGIDFRCLSRSWIHDLLCPNMNRS